MNAELNNGAGIEKNGFGFVINPGITLRYNLATRWVLFSKAEHMYAIPGKGNDPESSLGFDNLQTFNMGFGAGYRFR